MSTTPTQLSAKYRGAVVEDLQLPPAVCLSPSTPVLEVLQIAYEREFSQLPVLADPVPPQPRRLVGFVDVERLKAAFAAGKVQDVGRLLFGLGRVGEGWEGSERRGGRGPGGRVDSLRRSSTSTSAFSSCLQPRFASGLPFAPALIYPSCLPHDPGRVHRA